MSKLLFTALLVLFLAPVTFADDPKAEAPKDEAPEAEVKNADDAAPEAMNPEVPQVADPSSASKPQCEEIMAKIDKAKAVHHADYKAKGKAFFNWRKFNRQLHSISYMATDKPLADSVEKCQKEDKPGKDFCKGVMEEYNKISPKEKATKEKLDAAEEKSQKSRMNYNMLLEEAHDMDCLVNQKQ